MSWIAAFNKCHSYEANLPALEDKYLIMNDMKQKGWESVWTSIKKVKFDDFMWEDGSVISARNGKLK